MEDVPSSVGRSLARSVHTVCLARAAHAVTWNGQAVGAVAFGSAGDALETADVAAGRRVIRGASAARSVNARQNESRPGEADEVL